MVQPENTDCCLGDSRKTGQHASMRALLRHVPTGLYVQSAEQWTGDAEQAFDFKTMGQAIRFVEKAGLRKMELAFMSSQMSRPTEVPLEMLSWGPSISKRYNSAMTRPPEPPRGGSVQGIFGCEP
jgi:hypothetical protein